MQAALPLPSSVSSSSGARLVSADGRELSFRGATLHVRAEGGVAVVVLTQRFANPHAEPLSVRYTMPLPHDAAVRGYSFLLGAKLVRGEVDRKRQARERFERAVAEGRTAGLLDQERSTVFNQELGNLPPGEELVAMIELDQRLTWLDEGSWEWRFPTVVAPRYLGTPGRVADAPRLLVDVADAPLSPSVDLELHVLDALEGSVSSPTHDLAMERGAEGTTARLAASARLDRDLAVRWPVATGQVGAKLRTARGDREESSAHGLLTLIPPTPRSHPRPLPRDLILLVDASGSMHGAPLQQARELMRTLVHSLEETDRLEMISFGNKPHRWKSAPATASRATREEALRWIDRLQAEGGTEMRAGILEATRALRDGAQRQIVLITDGLIGFESEIVRALHETLPPSCRLHTVGVGASINRSLTGPAARAGRGVEIMLDLDGDAAEATRRLLARTVAPLVTELVVEGEAVLEHAPARLPDLFSGAPLLVSLRLRASGGRVRVRGRTPDGPWTAELTAPAVERGEGSPALHALFGRERVEDLEALWATGREQSAIDHQIEQTGLDYQIATRLTSWIAITEQRTVDPEAQKRHQVVPVELPYNTSAEGLGLRPGASLTDDDEQEESEEAAESAGITPRRSPSPAKKSDVRARRGRVPSEAPISPRAAAPIPLSVAPMPGGARPSAPRPAAGAPPPPPASKEKRGRYEEAEQSAPYAAPMPQSGPVGAPPHLAPSDEDRSEAFLHSISSSAYASPSMASPSGMPMPAAKHKGGKPWWLLVLVLLVILALAYWFARR